MKGDTSVPSYRHSYEPTSSENWDIEESEPRRAYCEAEEPEKIHSLVGMTKAQRREFNRKLLEVHKTNNAEMGNGEEPTEPDFCEEEVRRPKQLPKAVPRSSLDQQYLPPQSGAKLPVERGIPHGPIGVGRSMLMSGQNSMPRPGTTVQGRSIAANIFNSRDTDEESTSDRQEGGPRRAPTVALAASSIAPLVHTTTVPQSEFNNSPLPTNSGHNLAGLGRGLGVPRGSKRPGLGMPAVGLQSSTQTPGYPWTQP
ncbi:uncharacterized protein LOC110975344 [Acanthaster planci]|uniref:Uncharacterized protein LOC110975344 n=1 Tax=Acanthaster planci TaxID=133434 RepID=A0A8B7XTA9_ACAPL|nr:uncharacterized protein LOC110975344 [Acanthaster planci]